MKNKFFTHRFLPILSIFLFIAFVFTTNVFASSLSFHSVDTLNTDLPNLYQDMLGCRNGYENHLLLINTQDYYYLLACSKDLVVKNNSLYVSGSAPLYIWRISSDYTSYTTMFADGVNNFYINSNSFSYLANYEYMNTNYTIVDENNNLVFPLPPTVTEVLVEETNKTQIAEQLKIMIAGFLKYLIALVISVIAFWKGWQFLSTQLKKA